MEPIEPDNWQRLCDLFHQASKFEGKARETFLNMLSPDDKALRKDIEDLLRESDNAESGPLRTAAKLNAAEIVRLHGSDSMIGVTIGPYEIKKEVGRGGFGVVYLAQRSHDYTQQVAIKLLQADMATNDVIIRRFQLERQILADLNCENIARLIDGGSTESGCPYLVMEYVPGTPITEYCNKHQLDLGARLELFKVAARAVAHAHQFGVIHRDLKPSNILVTNEGVPKLWIFIPEHADTHAAGIGTVYSAIRQPRADPW